MNCLIKNPLDSFLYYFFLYENCIKSQKSTFLLIEKYKTQRCIDIHNNSLTWIRQDELAHYREPHITAQHSLSIQVVK